MDPREGDIAEDGQGNFLVYRGGNWYPANDKGYPLERIPRADYGERYFQQPNGDIVREGPRGGFEVIERAAEAGGGGSTLVGADARSRYQIGADPLVASARAAAAEEARGGNPLNRDWGAVLLAGVDLDPREGASLRPFAPLARLVGGQDYQNYDQALATYEASLLPIQSGAAVTESEARRQIRADFPQLGESEETVRRKAQNRLRRVNAVFLGIGRPPPFSEEQIANPSSIAIGDEIAALQSIQGFTGGAGPINPETGLPSYPAIERLTANAQELPLTDLERGGDGPTGPTGPGSSRELALDASTTDPALISGLLEQSGSIWVHFGDGVPIEVQRRADPGLRPGDVELQRGRVTFRPESPDEATERRRQMDPFSRYVDAGVRGIADSVTFGFADEIGAGVGAGLNALTGQEGLREGYQRRVAIERAINAADAQDAGAARFTGQALGAIAAPGAMTAGRFVANAPRLGYAMTRGAAVGAGGGAAYGTGSAEGGLAERGRGLMTGAVVGGATGAALPPVMRAAGAVTAPITRPIGNAVSDIARAATGRSLTPDERAARTLLRGQNPEQMRQTAAQMRRFGAEPTVADAAGSVVQGRTRVAATRQGPGRQVAEDFSAGRRADIQDFTAGLGRVVSETEATPAQIEGMLEQYQRQASAPAFGAVRGDRIGLDESSVLALRSPEGRKAIKDAANLYLSSTDPEDRAIAAELNRLADDVLDQPGQVQITVGGADLMSRYLAKAGGQDANRNRVFGGLGRALRQNATEQSPGYEQALTGFAQRARLGDANEIGQRFVGRGSARDFVSGVENMGPEGRTIARVAARSGIEQAAETPRGAMSMLDRLAVGRGQNQRAEALLGPEDAATLRQGGQVGRQLVATAQNVNPRAGSNTFLNMADGEEAAGGVMGNVMRGRFLQAAGGALDLIRSAGINDDQAERIVALALDPARTDEAIQILSTRLAPGVAQRTVAAIQQAANPAIASRTGGEQGRQASMTNPGF